MRNTGNGKPMYQPLDPDKVPAEGWLAAQAVLILVDVSERSFYLGLSIMPLIARTDTSSIMANSLIRPADRILTGASDE